MSVRVPIAGQSVFYQDPELGEVPAIVAKVYPWTLGQAISIDLFAFGFSGRGRKIPSDESANPSPRTWHTLAINLSGPSNGSGYLMRAGSPASAISGDQLSLSDRSSQSLSHVVGLLIADVQPTLPCAFITDGMLSLPDAAWALVTDEGANLSPGAAYYLSLSGKITTTPPSSIGSSVVFIGTAVNATDLDVKIAPPILL